MATSSKRHACLILLAHGSRDAAWRRPFIELESALRTRLGAEHVRLAFMEFTGPTLLDIAVEAAKDERLSLRVLPLFLAGGAHLSTDIPSQLAEVMQRFPRLHIELLSSIGEHPRVQALFQEIACEQALAASGSAIVGDD